MMVIVYHRKNTIDRYSRMEMQWNNIQLLSSLNSHKVRHFPGMKQTRFLCSVLPSSLLLSDGSYSRNMILLKFI
jgi:hypothetical protein